MVREPQSNDSHRQVLTLAPPSPEVARPTRSTEIVRAESELRAIDELMAELTYEFIADARR